MIKLPAGATVAKGADGIPVITMDVSGNPASSGPSGNTGPPSEPMLPPPREKVPSVTKGFCVDVIKAVSKKEAPYFLEGRFTGEGRTALLEQCSTYMCDWANEYTKAAESCDKGAPSCKPCTDKNQYVAALWKQQGAFNSFAGSILAKIAIVGEAPKLIKTIPAGDPTPAAAAEAQVLP